MAQEKIQLPRPTGSYNVGVSTHFLKDISRHHNDEESRPLLVRIYYPSVEIQKEYPPYLSDAMHLYKEKIVHTYNVSPEDLEYLDLIKDWAMPDARIVAANFSLSHSIFLPWFFYGGTIIFIFD